MIRGKKLNTVRYFGSFLLLLAFILNLIYDLLLVNKVLSLIFMFFLIIPWIGVVIMLKSEVDKIKNNKNMTISLLIGFSFFLSIVFYLFLTNNEFIFTLLLVIPDILLIFAWHFSISIYKKEKIIFIILVICFIVFSLLNKIQSYITRYSIIFGLLPYALTLFGISVILLAELYLKKKGLLVYIDF